MIKLRTRLWMILALLFALSGAAGIGRAASLDATGMGTSALTAAAAEATWTPIATLPVGSGGGQIAYQFHVEGGIDRGPQALAAAPDGTIYLLDSVQRRVHALSNRTVRNTIALPFANYPKDILATADGLYVLDDDNRVLNVSYSGKLLRAYKLPAGLASDQVYRLASSAKGKVQLWTAYYHVFDLDHLPASVDLEAGARQKDRRGRGIRSPGGDQWVGEVADLNAGQLVTSDGRKSITVRARGLFGSMRLIGFERGASQVYVSVEDLYDNAGRLGVELSVQRYRPDGRLTGGVRLPLERFVISPHRPVELAEDGALYVMVPGQKSTIIYRVEPGRTYTSVIPDHALQSALLSETSAHPSAHQPGTTSSGISIASLSTLSRRQVRDRGYTMADTTWTWHTSYDSFHDGRARPNDAVRPDQLTVAGGNPIADGTVTTGIPYTWGGLDSPWSHTDNQPWTSWSNALQLYYGNTPSQVGPLVGNTNTTCTTQCYPSGYHIGSAGIDCSGFVYTAAGFTGNPKKNTSSLQTDGVDWKGTTSGIPLNTQPMNFFVSNSHTFYYDYAASDAASINTLEATTDSSPDGAKRYSRSWASIVSSPSAFPYYRAWWNILSGDSPTTAKTTLGAGSATYGRGQSIWYQFTTSGPREVLLTNISGGDVDLYVYNASLGLVGRSVVAGTGSDIVRINAAGTYYARVYSFVESPGSTAVNYTIQVPNPVVAGIYDDQSQLVQYEGIWTHSTGWPKAHAGTVSWSNTEGAVTRLIFNGSRITYRYTMAYNRDLTDIYLDGVYEETINSFATDIRWQVARTWSLPPGVHMIEARVSTNGSGGISDLDAFVVDIPFASSGYYDDAIPQMQYIGAWTQGTASSGASGAYNQTLHWSSTSQDAATFTFSGSQIGYVYTRVWNRGKAAITIDGDYYGDVDLFAPSILWGQCNIFYLTPGIHTIHISVSGRKNPSASDYYVDVDELIVDNGCGGEGGG